MVLDGMHGVVSPYAVRMIGEMLGAPPNSLQRCNSMEDFGGCRPDPSLQHAPELIRMMGIGRERAQGVPEA